MGGKTSYESTKKYQDRVYDTLTVRLRKGTKARILALADSSGQSLNAYIAAAVDQQLARDAGTIPNSAEIQTSGADSALD